MRLRLNKTLNKILLRIYFFKFYFADVNLLQAVAYWGKMERPF